MPRARTLKELYDGWRNLSFGNRPTCPGCLTVLSDSELAYPARRSAFGRWIRMTHVPYCGRVECLHIILDERELVLQGFRQRLGV